MVENEFIKVMLRRRSCRKFTDQPVEKEKVETLLHAAMAGPSAKDVRPWRFVVIDDRQLLDQLAEGLPYAKMLKSAPLAFVVCGDITPFTEGKTINDLWDQDCSIASENIVLAAESLGLGAVWTAVYPYPDRMNVVIPAVGLPENVLPLCVIPVGYPENPGAEPKQKFNPDNIHYNKW